MTHAAHASLQQAIAQMTDILIRENAALAATDFARAGEILAEKQLCAVTLAQAFREAEPDIAVNPDSLRTLANLADDNRRLLLVALRVQRRVLELVARAARAATAQNPTSYAKTGSARGTRRGANNLLTRA